MAYTQSDFVKDLALYSAGATIGVTRSRKMLEYAAKKGIQLGGLALRRGAVPAARAAVAIPGAAPLGAAALGYEAYRRGYLDPLLDPATEAVMARTMPLGQQIVEAAPIAEDIVRQTFPIKRKRVKSGFNKAVSAGMKAVKSSTSYGKKGTINNAKRAFSAVTKVASAANKKKKAPKKGIRRKIWNAVKKYV
jgi:hypothetical protein